MIEEIEIWKDIPGYEGLYQASSFGNIRGVDRIVSAKGRFNIKISGRPIKQKINLGGYVGVHLRRDRKNFYPVVHRLVALAFIPNPENLPQVNHIDGNKLNNKVDNLEWITALGNMKHASENNLLKPKIGVESSMSKLTDGKVLEIREKFSIEKLNHRELSNEYNVSVNLILSIIKGRIWKHVGGKIINLKLTRCGMKHGRAKLNNSDIPVIKDMYKNKGKTLMEIGNIYGLDYSSIRNIVNGKTWKHIV